MSLNKKQKEKFEDDGRVVADMDYEHITGYKSKKHRENHRAIRELHLSRKERWAIYKAALASILPTFGIFIMALVASILFLYILILLSN